jgi:hypothetical protein
MMEYFYCMYKALVSNPITEKKKIARNSVLQNSKVRATSRKQ